MGIQLARRQQAESTHDNAPETLQGVEEILQTIEESLESFRSAVDVQNAILYGKMEAGRMTLIRTRISAHTLVKNVADQFMNQVCGTSK
jgi:hypothetical protein